MILIDTSGLLAACFPNQKDHERCAAVLRSSDRRILSPFVLAELDYLISRHGGVGAALDLLDDVGRQAYELASFDYRDVGRAHEIVSQHRDLRVGLADASLVVLAERYEVADLLTLDQRHFRVLAPTHGSFRILPADS